MAFNPNKIPTGKLSTTTIVLAVLAVLALLFGEGIENPFTDKKNNSTRTEQRRTDPAAGGDFNARDLNYRGKDMVLTKHAKCRMGCRFIDAYEVNEVLKNGKINKRKSNPNDKPCPTYSLESRTRDGQMVRAVVAECDNVVKLITVIDLDNHYKCHCK